MSSMNCDTMAVDVTNENLREISGCCTLSRLLSYSFAVTVVFIKPTVSRVVLTIHKSTSWQNTPPVNSWQNSPSSSSCICALIHGSLCIKSQAGFPQSAEMYSWCMMTFKLYFSIFVNVTHWLSRFWLLLVLLLLFIIYLYC